MKADKKNTVLLIDDDFAIRMMFRKLLEEAGFSVIGEAEDGREGVELHNALKPDITLCDIEMPVMHGIAALKTILASFPTSCVIMLTSVNHPEVWEDCLLAGARFYINKSSTHADIIRIIRDSWNDHQKLMAIP
ncbi:MAG: response regulator transcription factor [Magnetococcales bacterium]|nr:response regulator transcription factor [Magnetococcales bacterium]